MFNMKSIVKRGLQSLGYEIKRKPTTGDSGSRPVGDMKSFLEGLKQCGLDCRYIMDVGANKTDWSRLAAQVFPGSSFVLIEPQTEMKTYLDAFCADYPSSKYFMAGAGAARGVLTLTVWDDLAGSSFLPASDDTLRKANKQRDIEILTIDDIIRDNGFPVPDFIKLDIQGFELEALKGASHTFGKTEAYLLEVSLFNFSEGKEMPVFSDVVNFMLERGYVVYDFPGFLRRPYDQALGQCDVCFVKKEGVLRNTNRWN